MLEFTGPSGLCYFVWNPGDKTGKLISTTVHHAYMGTSSVFPFVFKTQRKSATIVFRLI